jgi:hypothetical protein
MTTADAISPTTNGLAKDGQDKRTMSTLLRHAPSLAFSINKHLNCFIMDGKGVKSILIVITQLTDFHPPLSKKMIELPSVAPVINVSMVVVCTPPHRPWSS